MFKKKKIDMKKIYIAPDTKEVEIGICRMVCVSGTLDKNQTIESPGGFGSRRGGSFFDDEDDDY